MNIEIELTPKDIANLIRLGYLDERRTHDKLVRMRAVQMCLKDLVSGKLEAPPAPRRFL